MLMVKKKRNTLYPQVLDALTHNLSTIVVHIIVFKC